METDESQGFLTRLQAWAMYPFQNQMDILDSVLTTLLVTTLAFAWIMVLKHLIGEE